MSTQTRVQHLAELTLSPDAVQALYPQQPPVADHDWTAPLVAARTIQTRTIDQLRPGKRLTEDDIAALPKALQRVVRKPTKGRPVVAVVATGADSASGLTVSIVNL